MLKLTNYYLYDYQYKYKILGLFFKNLFINWVFKYYEDH